MNHSAKILVVLATLPLVPIMAIAGAAVGAAVALKFCWLWLEFVWEEM